MNELGRDLIALLLWPGLLSAALLGWALQGIGRKFMARMQGRRGPSVLQPLLDFLKLLGKRTLVPAGTNPALFYGLPLVSLVAVICALAMLPAPGNPATHPFAGDVIVFIYLLEVPALCEVIAGYSSRSLYGQVSAAREALLSLGYNIPLLAAVIALAWHVGSFRLQDLMTAPVSPVHIAAGLAVLLTIPAKLKTNPFSIPNAEQEIVDGAHTEFNGAPLALLKLTHGLELVALAGFVAALLLPGTSATLISLAGYLLISLLIVLAVTVLAASTARIKLQQAFRFYWLWGSLVAVLTLVAAVLG